MKEDITEVKRVLNNISDLIEVLFNEVVRPSNRHYEDQIEFENAVENKISDIRYMIEYLGDK